MDRGHDEAIDGPAVAFAPPPRRMRRIVDWSLALALATLATAVAAGDRLLGPALIAAVGALPAAAAATFALEGTSPRPKRLPGVAVAFAPTGLAVTF